MTLSEIKAALPKYIYLTPGVHKWKRGDEFHDSLMFHSVSDRRNWHELEYQWVIGVARRPIPDEVLENQAFWALYNRLATVAPDQKGYTLIVDYCPVEKWRAAYVQCLYGDESIRGQRKFESPEMLRMARDLLDGEQNITEHLSAGDLYSKWIGEQII